MAGLVFILALVFRLIDEVEVVKWIVSFLDFRPNAVVIVAVVIDGGGGGVGVVDDNLGI